MKPKSTLRSYLAIAGSSLLAISYTHAATYYWDGTNTTANADGGAGNWDNTLTNWDTLAAGGADIAWSAGDTAVFTVAAAASTVTLTDNITVGGLTFNGRNTFNGNIYTLNAATNSRTLSFSSGDNTILFNPSNGAASAIITGQVAGTGANVIVRRANPVYPSTVTFNGTSTGGWTGTTTINPGMTVSLAGSNQALLNTSGITLNGGNILLTNTATGSENTIDRVSNTAAITSSGSGSISIANTSAAGRQYSETIGSITHSNGQLSLGFTTVQNGTAPSTQTLMVGGLTNSGTTSTIAINGGGSGAGSLHGNSFIRVNGITTSTAANEIIGPWITAGNILAAQSDWAVYQSDGVSGRVVSRNIAASAQTTWTSSSATGNYTAAMGSPTAITTNNTLTADRFVNTLRTTFSESNNTTSHTMTAATDTITFAGHALNNGDVVGFRAATGLTDSRPYYVINSVAGTSFQLSLTPGGPLLDLTSDTEGFITTGLNLNGKTLGTSGFITGTTGAAAIGGGSASTITLPTTTSGNLYLHGAASIWIDSPIKDNGAGVLTLVKSGTTAVTLSGNNTFTGGLVVNAGTLRLTGDQSFTGGVTLSGGAFGDSTDGIGTTEINSNSLTVNGNANMFITSGSTIAGAVAITSTGNLVLNGDAATFSGVVSGSGQLTTFSKTSATVTLTNTANTHTGVIVLSNDNNSSGTLAVNSLADSASPGAGNILMGGGSAIGGPTFALHSGAVAPLILNNRQFDLLGDVTNLTNKLSNSSVQAFTIGSNLLASGTGIKTLTLGGTGIGLSTFGGTITNGSLTTLNLTKADANNTWSLTNAASSYNGVTTVSAGTLRFSSIADAGANSSLGNFATAGATGISLGGGTLQYTGASGVSVNRGFTLAANSAINVNPVNTALTIGNSSLGAFTLSVTGGTGSSLGLGALTLTGAATLNPTTANLTVASVTATNQGLTLGGTSSGNTVTGAINTGSGTLTKNTASTWTLSGTNGYTGATTVSAGLLRVNGSLNASSAVGVSAGAIGGTGTIGGAVTVSGTGRINLSNGSVGTLTLSSTLANTGAAAANNFTFDLASGGSTLDKIAASGAFSMTNSGAVVVNPNQLGGSANRLTAGTYDLMTAASGLTAGGDQFRLATTKAFGQTFSLASTTTTALKLTTAQVSGAVLTNTTLSGTTPSWQDSTKFSGAAIPDYMSNVIINSAIGASLLNGSTNINSLTFGTSATTAVSIGAGTATAGTVASMLVIEAGTHNGNTAGNGITLSNASGTHTISANVGLAASQTWTVATGAGLSVSGVISDFGGGYGLTKEGGGTLTLSGVNTFNGPLTIASGTVRADGNSPKGTNSLLGAGTTLVMGSNGQTGRLAILFDSFPVFDKDITLATGGTGEFQYGNGSFPAFNITNTDRAMTFSGNISDAGNFTKLGGATIILSGNNTYTGTTTINEGALRFSSATALPGGIGVTGGISALTINGNATAASNNVGAVVSLTAASGDFRRSLGTGADQFQITGGVSGFEANGSARQVVVGNDAAFELQWGNASFNPSALLLGYNLVTATGALTLLNKIDLNAATRTIQNNSINATATISGDIRTSSGTAGLTKTGVGTLALSGSNTYNGPTTIRAGALSVGASNHLGTGGDVVFNGTTLQITGTSYTSISGGGHAFTFNPGTTSTLDINNAANTFTADQVLTGTAVNFTKAGAGTLVFNQANTYTGGTTISAGTLRLDAGGVIPTALPLVNNATFTVNSAGSVTQGTHFGLMSGTGVLTKAGAGTLTLNLANTFSGTTTVSAGTIAITNSLALQNSAYNTTGSNGSTIGLDVTNGLSSNTLTLGGLAGSVNLNSAFTAGFTGTVTNLTLNPQSGITSTYGGVIDNGSMSLTKTGAGTQTLTGANLYTGATSINSGTLNLGGTTATGSLASTVLNLGGGTLSYTRTGNTTQTFTTTNINPGASGAATVTGNFLKLGDVVRTVGGTLNVGNAGSITTTDTNTNAILGGWATFNNENWAVANGDNSAVTGLGVYTIANATAATNLNTNMDAAGVTIGGVINTNSIRFSGGSVKTLTLATGDNIIQSGGILVRSDVAANLQTITGGNLLGSSGGDLIIHQYSTGSLTIASLIKDNGTATALTKSGSGTLTLSNASNSYSGGTVLNAGTLSTTNNGQFGVGGGISVNGTATWDTGNGTPTYARAITINSGTLSLSNSSVNAIISGALTGSGGITVSGTGQFQFTNTGNTFTGTVTSGYGLHFASLGDSANPINISNASVGFRWIGGTQTFASRPFTLNAAPAGIINNSGTGALTIQQNLAITGAAGARALTLTGSYTGSANTFSGNIADGPSSVVSFTKAGVGTWVLTNSNTYTGATSITGGGTLVVSGTGSKNTGVYTVTAGTLTGTTPTAFGNTSSIDIGGTGILQLRGDANATFGQTNGGAAYTSTITATGAIINVDRNTVAGTNQTFTLGAQTVTSVAAAVATTVTGANNTSLILGAISGPVSTAAATHSYTNNITGGGNLTLASYTGRNTSGGEVLTFGGIGNTTVTGTISQNGANAVALTKSGGGTLTLSGNNTFSGGVTISAASGMVIAGHNNALGSGTVTLNSITTLELADGITLNNAFTATAQGNSKQIRLQAGATSAIYAGNITNSEDAATNFSLNASSGGTLTASGIISGVGGFNTSGLGTIVLTSTNSYVQGTTVGIGSTLSLGSGGTTGRLTATTSIANAGNLTINRSDAFSQATDLGAGVIISGTGSFTQAGAGTTTLTATNTYTGATNVNGGTLSLGHATNTLANTGVVNVNGGILALGANSDTVGSVSLASGSITGSGTLTAATYSLTGGTLAAQLGAGAVTVNGAVTFSAAGRLNASSSLLIQGGTLTLAGDETVASFQQTGGTIAGGFGINSASDFELESGTLSGKMGGNGGLKKRGGGKTTITGNNTYTGATDIMEGTLLVNGSTAAGSTVAVSAGATLGGTGTIGGAVNVSGVLSPGASIETLGTGTLSLTNGSTLVHELNSGVATAVGSDLLVVTGNLNLAGTVGLTLSDLASPTVAFNVNDVFSIINYTGTWNGGLFTFGGNELANAEEFSFGLNTWRINYNAPTGGLNFANEYVSGSFVNLTVIPEPSSVALLGTLGAIMLLRRRRG